MRRAPTSSHFAHRNSSLSYWISSLCQLFRSVYLFRIKVGFVLSACFYLWGNWEHSHYVKDGLEKNCSPFCLWSAWSSPVKCGWWAVRTFLLLPQLPTGQEDGHPHGSCCWQQVLVFTSLCPGLWLSNCPAKCAFW